MPAPSHHIQEQILQTGIVVSRLLRDIADSTNVSALRVAAGVGLLIFETAQIVKTNKEKCALLTSQVLQLLCAIVNCSEDAADLSPTLLHSITVLTSTLQKVLSWMRAQAKAGLMKRIVRHLENASLLDDCVNSLQHALRTFRVQTDVIVALSLAEMQEAAKRRHQEILTLLDHRREATRTLTSLQESSSSLSVILPPSPKVFHGREDQLSQIFATVSKPGSPRIAILGPGGVGKSSLALAVMHNPEVLQKFGHQRHWIPCEGSSSPEELIATLATYFGLEKHGDPLKAVLKFLAQAPSPTLLVLDNFETPWEAAATRADAEEFLSQLSDLDGLTLMITMRGAERPGQVSWSRPFIPPLEPLDDAAARETFLDISDLPETDPNIEEVIALTDKLPLALSLVANMASFEGCGSILARWKTDRVAIVSDGIDKRSNLEKSIALSLFSPRVDSTPNARELLSMLSLLPDGIDDLELEQLALPFSDVAKCRTTLLRTSLAYYDPQRRLKVLVPIREYVLHNLPRSIRSILVLRKYLFDLVGLGDQLEKTPGLVRKFSSNINNIRTAIRFALDERQDVKDAIKAIINLNPFYSVTEIGSFELLRSIAKTIDELDDEYLRGQYLLALVSLPENYQKIETLTLSAAECFQKINDMSRESRAYHLLGLHYWSAGRVDDGLRVTRKAYSLAKAAHDPDMQSWALHRLHGLYYAQGQYLLALSACQQSLAIAHDAGHLHLEFLGLQNTAVCILKFAKFNQAIELLQQSVQILDALGLSKSAPSFLDVFGAQGEIHWLKTEYAEASHMFGLAAAPTWSGQTLHILNKLHADLEIWGCDLDDARRQLETLSLPPGKSLCSAYAQLVWGSFYQQLGEYKRADTHCVQYLKEGNFDELTAVCFRRRGDLAMSMAADASAFRNYVLYYAMTARGGDRVGRLVALQRIGDIFVAEKDYGTAASLFELTLDGFTTMDIHRARADCLLRLGDIARVRGDVGSAREQWTRARPLFQRSGREDGLKECDERLDLTA